MSNKVACFLCGASTVSASRYINARALGPLRYLAYRIPLPLARGISRILPQFGRAYRSVETNRRYFDIEQLYCSSCGTGRVDPPFSEERLSRYYADYYWDNRDAADGQHLADDARPNDRQIAWSRERLSWLDRWTPAFSSVIDFGAGDCAAGYVLRDRASVHAVDPSPKSAAMAKSIGIGWRATLAECPQVDLFYASHSLEHVHDLLGVFAAMVEKVRPGGHLFFEVPNVSSREVFDKLYHSPHTFALSAASFAQLAPRFGCRIIAIEAVGGPWQVAGHSFADPSPADLRVLLQRLPENADQQ